MHIETKRGGDGRPYRVCNGTWYHEGTPDAAIKAVEIARQSHTRIHLNLGDTQTGRSWGEVHDVTGYVGRSMGPIKIPILIYNSRSIGGSGILTHCILSIHTSRGNRLLYQLEVPHAERGI